MLPFTRCIIGLRICNLSSLATSNFLLICQQTSIQKARSKERLEGKLSAWMEDKKSPKFSFSELKQGRRRRQRERYRKMELRVSVMISQLFQVILPAKCIVSVLE